MKNAPRFLPLIGALFMFILFNNLFADPGFAPTDTLKTNVGIALAVFFLTAMSTASASTASRTSRTSSARCRSSSRWSPIELISQLSSARCPSRSG